MMLVTMEKILKDAEDKGYAVPAFNGYNLETVQAILETAEEMRAPVILQVYSRLFTKRLGYYIGILVQWIAREMSVPITLQLVHGKDEEEIIKAIRYGYTGVMIDGSARPLAENIELTRRVVKIAGVAGVSVE